MRTALIDQIAKLQAQYCKHRPMNVDDMQSIDSPRPEGIAPHTIRIPSTPDGPGGEPSVTESNADAGRISGTTQARRRTPNGQPTDSPMKYGGCAGENRGVCGSLYRKKALAPATFHPYAVAPEHLADNVKSGLNYSIYE